MKLTQKQKDKIRRHWSHLILRFKSDGTVECKQHPQGAWGILYQPIDTKEHLKSVVLTPEIQNKIVSILEGTNDLLTGQIEDLCPEADEEDIMQVMIDHGYDRCHDCGIWYKLYDLEDHPNDCSVFICSSCKEEYEE